MNLGLTRTNAAFAIMRIERCREMLVGATMQTTTAAYARGIRDALHELEQAERVMMGDLADLGDTESEPHDG